MIGNANYPDNDSVLNDAANDARDVADELTRDGFAVEKGINLSGEAMRQALERFCGRIERGGIALLFFDGFGIQTPPRQTFLLPVDAQIWAEADVAHDGLNLETILDQMDSRGAAIKDRAARCVQEQPVRTALPPLLRGPCTRGDAERHAGALLRSSRLGRQQQPE